MTRSLSICFALVLAAACSHPQEAAAPRPHSQGLVTMSGKVIERSRVWTPEGAPRDIMKLQTADGQTVLVHLGVPGGEGTIAEGDRVTVTGARMRSGAEGSGAEDALFARYVLQDSTPGR
jgi:hypothetical protein